MVTVPLCIRVDPDDHHEEEDHEHQTQQEGATAASLLKYRTREREISEGPIYKMFFLSYMCSRRDAIIAADALAERPPKSFGLEIRGREPV